MIAWLLENLGTIIISLVLVLIVAAIILSLVREKKTGKPSCCGGCAHCNMCTACKHAGKTK